MVILRNLTAGKFVCFSYSLIIPRDYHVASNVAQKAENSDEVDNSGSILQLVDSEYERIQEDVRIPLMPMFKTLI